MMSFTDALVNLNLKAVRSIPKSDLHNHCMMGGRLKQIEKFYGSKLEKFTDGKKGVEGINEWIMNIYRPVFSRPGAFNAAAEAAFLQARSDGITVLEMSVDVTSGRLFKLSPENVIDILKKSHLKIAPEIDFRPEVGISRILSIRTVLACIEPYLHSGFFRSIDLYDIESAQSIHNYSGIYRYAKSLGLKCKAHAGEFGDAESVREAVETLDLDAVQHGIGIAQSPEIMKWFAKNSIPLNVCPASNISLKRAGSYKTHPIRILFDHGVKVTVNTDDVMLFDKGNSEQFLKLYRCGLFTAEELDQIRRSGLL
jgi:adenosine deaminase